ncbi:DUF3822 family protein [Aquimarina gracilis]|uniref:DUF3822 family protein n=1 Tax=Aquimarina gracilis TaxID=874422 RepID=A0ABU6A2J4_9FLAO|nr:DUF3822 family protein [Aquimarina gracilis]MEB3348306.1 DUF3822 family protein [Aquimarina gracilis]
MVQTTSNTNTISKKLSIQVSLNGLSFCTLDANQKIKALEQDNFGIQLSPEQVLDKIKYTFDNNPALQEDFEVVEVIHQNDLYSLVPKALFDKNSLKEYLMHNIRILENDFLAYDEMEQHEIVTVYVPYTNINNFFFDTFGSFTYKHACTVLTSTLLTQEKHSYQTTVFANMNEKSFDLIVIRKGKLLLANTFNHETKEDFLYYLLFATEQLQLNPEEFKLVFLGDILATSEYVNITHKYIRNMSFGNHSKSEQLTSTIKPIEPHQHFVLLSHF